MTGVQTCALPISSVPKYPASHGCIRVPLTEGNPAKLFYEWVSKGTPIEIVKK